MILGRKGLWLAYGLICLVYSFMPSVSRLSQRPVMAPPEEVWRLAGQMVFQFNMFMAFAAGILSAECLKRDELSGVRELQRSTPLRNRPYVAAKYVGTLASVLAPYVLWMALFGMAVTALGLVPAAFLPALLAAFASIAVPGHAFVVAISMAGPLVMPLRVFQVLFTGYWFWGNYLNPSVFPTLNGTLVTPSGVFAFDAFFGGFKWTESAARHTPGQAWLNLTVLGLCAVVALMLAERHLARRERRA